jgi:hypothetical protein
MFCGECGRAVGTRTTRIVDPDSGMPVGGSAIVGPATEAAVEAPSAAKPAPDAVVVVESPRDTAIIEPILRGALPELETELPPAPAAGPHDAAAEPEATHGVEAGDEPEQSDEPDDIEQDLPPEVLAAEAAAAEPTDLPLIPAEPEPQSEPEPDPEPEPQPEPEPGAQPGARSHRRATAPATGSVALPPRPDPFPWGDRGSAIFSDSDELEQTLIVPRRDTGERFVLQFSTGESVTVFGSGLLGRNPAPQPTEYFDQLVSITDPGKSVSKTHLEFGQEAGSFWVSDRFSGNGSAVREPESSPRRLVAGKRYRIVRGTRVDIGEQFFVVS